MTTKNCTIIGYGPGLGAAYARAFHEAGYTLALISRSGGGPEPDDTSGPAIRSFACDVGDSAMLKSTLEEVQSSFGPTDVTIYNADLARFGTLDDISEEAFEESWRVSVHGLFATAKYIAENGLGALIVSGATAALRGNLWTTAFAPAKAAQRILAQSLAKQLGPKGLHIAYIVIDGVIDTADTRTNFAPDEPDEFFIKPDHIANTALMLARQDPSAWTFEIDIRPFGEKW